MPTLPSTPNSSSVPAQGRPEVQGAIASLRNAIASVENILTPDEKASGQYGIAEYVLGMLEWVGVPDDLLYVPDDRLKDKLKQYKASTQDSSMTTKNKGEMMEEIALLAFGCLKGLGYVKSYPSYAEQHDLVVTGNTPLWEKSVKSIMGRESPLTIVIEAKYHSKPLDSALFTRLCYILQNKFTQTSSLGVFLSNAGATGMNTRRSLSDAKAAQIIFHARTEKYVVVLDRTDILQLGQPGALIRILRAKIHDVEAGANIALSQHDNMHWVEVDLPPHLAQYLDLGSLSQTDATSTS